MGPKLINCCKTGTDWHQRVWQNNEGIQVLVDGRVPAKEASSWRIEGRKRRITRKEYQRVLNKFVMEGFMAQKVLWKLVREKPAGKRSVAEGRG